MSKGTIAIYVNGVRKAEGPSSSLLMERLSLELVRPGSLKATLGKVKLSLNPQIRFKTIWK